MNIRGVIKTINQMQTDGVIERYAVGGAVGATFYLEPIATLDVDIFVTFKSEAGSVIITPQRIYDYLTARGATVQGLHFRPDVPRTKPGCSISLKPACWTRPVFKPSWPGTDCWRRGKGSSNSSSATSHDL
jgi:hypothetical protein